MKREEKGLSVVELVAITRLQGNGFITAEGERMFEKLFEEEVMPRAVIGNRGKVEKKAAAE